jgi:glycosyltransferase involved in cell wall biosynthesis
MPLSILEAFASGLPVVTTDVGGIPYMVSHRINGLMAPAGDHQALADHVLELIAKPELALSLTRAAARNREAFSWQSVRRQWLDVYRDVLARAEAADGGRSSVGPVAAGVQARERQP